ALLEQQLCRSDVGAARDQHQRRLPVCSGGIRIRAGVEQRLDDLGVGVEGRLEQRRGLELVPDVRVRAALQQLPDLGGIIITSGDQQGNREQDREHDYASTSFPVLSPSLSWPT